MKVISANNIQEYRIGDMYLYFVSLKGLSLKWRVFTSKIDAELWITDNRHMSDSFIYPIELPRIKT